MKNTLQKAKYLKEYRLKNRVRLTSYASGYLKRSGRKYYNNKGNKELNYNLLGMPGRGRAFEFAALTLLKGSIDTNKDGFNKNSWDLIWNGKKIDVKMQNFCFIKKGGMKWCFTVNDDVDYVMYFCCELNHVVKVLFIPCEKLFSNKKISVGIKSKWDKYIFETKTSH